MQYIREEVMTEDWSCLCSFSTVAVFYIWFFATPDASSFSRDHYNGPLLIYLIKTIGFSWVLSDQYNAADLRFV